MVYILFRLFCFSDMMTSSCSHNNLVDLLENIHFHLELLLSYTTTSGLKSEHFTNHYQGE